MIPAQLLLLLDSRSPAGANNHSTGMESAVTAGYVYDVPTLRAFCRARLATSTLTNAAFAAASCRQWAEPGWHRLDTEMEARIPSPATRTASRALGNGLRRLLLSMLPERAEEIRQKFADCGRPAPHQPLVLGAATALVGGDPTTAALASALGGCTGPASAAVRLLGLDPYAAHAMTAELAGEIEAVATRAAAWIGELPSFSAPALDLLADLHTQAEVRLFAS